MGTMLDALVRLQSIERQLHQVRARLKTRQRSVLAQQGKIQKLQDERQQLRDQATQRRKQADQLDLDLKAREERIAHLRSALNQAKTNKEYASLLTQINTLKADNAKLEEQALTSLQDVDSVTAEAENLQARIEVEQKRLEQIEASTAEEIQRLERMIEDLTAQRQEAAGEVSPETLAIFERIARNYEGEAMAKVEVHGRKPPHDYVCGGCYMGLRPEHANALRTRDEIRRCDSCGRILYMESRPEKSPAQ